ncbi:DUF1835 domain-containing protein [Paenibacillus mendelii]|uniref:DUF1835 domain-containing protein n=1 Tax=Paenibacillus mendelii TaxID=206163 RepID=A0ABV6JB66_9BACL|nr:DUF1835 domain-containing protein [Paenibacillus mendelii]MCQ6564105.1 DUF1835 domain-containing protein [Paenibacillus mendelii]
MEKHLEIRKAINRLSLQEAKQLITIIKLQLDMVERDSNGIIDLYKNLKDLYEKLLVPNDQISIWEPNDAATKVHIVFGDVVARSLKDVIRQLGIENTNKMVSFRDQFTIGPLWQLHEETGRARRVEWLRDHINNEFDCDDYDYDTYHQRLMEQIDHIPAEACIMIWSGNNAHEQIGLRYALYLLRKKQNEIFVFNAVEACERRFNTSDQHIKSLHTGEIPPEKLQNVFGENEDNGLIDFETKKLMEHEWLSLANHHNVLRIWDRERIQNVDENYFDSYLLKTIEKLHAKKSNHDFIKAGEVMGEALRHCDHHVADNYFEYRLRQLIYNQSLEIKGVPRGMRFYSVRRIFNTSLR